MPARVRPPRHLADLTPQERGAVVTAAGERAFRARQPNYCPRS
jgi:23S rRNA (adenine2503-C2)-methyltransferase